MPAKKIIDAVMSTLAVIGSSMATATAGPMPGSTPTAVPSTQPTKAHSRLIGLIAVAKPCRREAKMSMSDPAGSGQAGQVDREELGEGPVHRRRDPRAGDRIRSERARRAGLLLSLGAAQALHREQVAQRAAENEADRGDQRRIGQQPRRDPDHARPP